MSSPSDDTMGLEEGYYIVSRGDFAGFARLEATGSDLPTTMNDHPRLASDGSSSTLSQGRLRVRQVVSNSDWKTNRMRKISVNELVSKVNHETPRSQDKLLPTLSPEERAQRKSLTQYINEIVREEDQRRIDQEATERSSTPRWFWPHSSPMSTVERCALPDGPSTEAGIFGLAPTFLFGSPPTFATASMEAGEWTSTASSRINTLGTCNARPHPNGMRAEDVSEIATRLFEVQGKAGDQIEEQRKRRMEEQILRGEPVEVAPSSMSYVINKDGNVIDVREGPREKVTVGCKGEDGSYGVLGYTAHVWKAPLVHNSEES